MMRVSPNERIIALEYMLGIRDSLGDQDAGYKYNDIQAFVDNFNKGIGVSDE